VNPFHCIVFIGCRTPPKICDNLDQGWRTYLLSRATLSVAAE